MRRRCFGAARRLAAHSAAFLVLCSTVGVVGQTASDELQGLITKAAGSCQIQASNGDAGQAAAIITGIFKGLLTGEEHYSVSVAGASPLEQGQATCVQSGAANSVAAGDLVESSNVLGRQLQLLFNGGKVNPAILPEVAPAFARVIQAVVPLRSCCYSLNILKVEEDATKLMKNLEFKDGKTPILLLNGADVLFDVSQAAVAYRDHQFQGFGRCVGHILRKTLLADRSSSLPELPGNDEMQKASWGLLEGYFGPDILSAAESDDASSSGEAKRLDLRQCMESKQAVFGNLWSGVFLVMAQTKVGARRRERLLAPVSPSGEGTQWIGALTASLLQAPSMLQGCGLPQDKAHMLSDGLAALGQLHLGVSLSKKENEALKLPKLQLATAAAPWSNGEWDKFGSVLGRFLQESVVAIRHQQYYVDGSRNLQKVVTAPKKVVATEAAPPPVIDPGGAVRSSVASRLEDSVNARPGWVNTLMVVGVALLLLAALVALKTRRTLMTWDRGWCHNPNTRSRDVYDENDVDVGGARSARQEEVNNNTTRNHIME